MMAPGNYDRDIGRLEAVVSSLEKQNTDLKAEIGKLHKDLTEIKELVLQIKGGSRVLTWLIGIASGGIGAALLKFILPLVAR